MPWFAICYDGELNIVEAKDHTGAREAIKSKTGKEYTCMQSVLCYSKEEAMQVVDKHFRPMIKSAEYEELQKRFNTWPMNIEQLYRLGHVNDMMRNMGLKEFTPNEIFNYGLAIAEEETARNMDSDEKKDGFYAAIQQIRSELHEQE